MRCASSEVDFDKRVQIGSGRVVHAGRMKRVYTQTYYRNGEVEKVFPEGEILVTACAGPINRKLRESVELMKELSGKPMITCKNCMKAIGIPVEIDRAGNAIRYALMEKESGYFFKKTGWRSSWTPEVTEATLYMLESGAAANGSIFFYEHKSSGERLTPQEYRKLDSSLKTCYTGKKAFNSERYVVRKVRVELIEE